MSSKTLKAFIGSIDRNEVLIPKLRDFLNKEEAAVLSGKISKKASVKHDARLTVMTFNNRIKEFDHGEDPKGDYYHPSQIGGCQRQQFFDIFQAPRDSKVGQGEDLLRRYMVFETGTYIHVIIQNLCSRAGLMIKREVGIIDPKLKIIGHADAKIKIDGKKYVLEIKSINSMGYAKLGDGPKHEHKAQAHAYMKALGYTAAIFIYFNKDMNTLREFVVEFDEKFYQEHVRRRIDTFFAKVKKRELPEPEGTNPKAFPCMFCPFTKVCWETGRAQAFLTRIKNEKAKHRHET